MTVTFFGHGDAPDSVKNVLIDILIDLIDNRGATHFYVGNHGNFDRYVASVLEKIKQIYPNIECNIVLAYLPLHNNEYRINTVFPEGIETIPKKFAINFRNKWMIEQSDTIVAYVTHSFGGAARFVEMARKKKKEIINIDK